MFAQHSKIFVLTVQNAPASSSRDSASALRDGGPSAAARSSLHVIASIILLALIIAAVGGGDLILQRSLQLRLDISGAPYTRHRPFRRGPDKVSATLTGKEWSRPMLHDHAELAAQEQAQREAIPARCGGKLTSHGSIPQRQSIVAPARTERFFRGPARRLVSLSPATRLASTMTTQLALLQSAPSTIICSRSVQMHRPDIDYDAAIRAALLSLRLQAAQHLL